MRDEYRAGSFLLEQESGVDVETSVSVLFVERFSVFKSYDEILIHDEAQACPSGEVELVVCRS